MRHLRIEVLDEGGVLRLVDPAGRVLGRRSVAAGEIDALIDEVAGAYAAPAPPLSTLGHRLHDWLDGSGQRWLSREREALRGEGLCVRLDVEHRLRHLPWELVADNGAFLVADVARPFCRLRQVSPTGRAWGAANRPLRALFMASSPEGVLPVLDFEEEEVRILRAAGAGGVELVVEERGSLAGLAERLRDHGAGYFDVLHLSGHADVAEGLGPHLLLETDTGRLDRTVAERLIAAVEGHWPRVVFVSGCRTGEAPERGVEPSFAERLVAAGAPCVVGWAQPVGDLAATAVAASLYQRLGAGERVDEAVARARQDALERGWGDWHLLRLYADGSPLGPLVTRRATPGRQRLRLRPAHTEFLDANQASRVCPHDRFVGRRRILQRCLRHLGTLHQADANYAEGLVISGMGGLGKSSVAARLCERLSGYRRLVWVGELDEGELLRVMAERLGPAATKALNEPGVDLRQRLRAVLELLEDPVLFVLDDFERNVEGHAAGRPRLTGPGGAAVLAPAALDVLDAVLWSIRETASPARVVITCRYEIAGPTGPTRLVSVPLEQLAGPT